MTRRNVQENCSSSREDEDEEEGSPGWMAPVDSNSGRQCNV